MALPIPFFNKATLTSNKLKLDCLFKVVTTALIKMVIDAVLGGQFSATHDYHPPASSFPDTTRKTQKFAEKLV